MVKRYTLEIIQQVKEVDKAISGTVKTGSLLLIIANIEQLIIRENAK